MHRFLIVFICCSLLIGFVPQAAEANSTSSRLSSNESQSTTQTLYVDARNPEWTDTGIVIHPGYSVRISASDRVDLGPAPASRGCSASGYCWEGEHLPYELLRMKITREDGSIWTKGVPDIYDFAGTSSVTGRLSFFVKERVSVSEKPNYKDNSGKFAVTIRVEKFGEDNRGREVCLDGDDRIVTTAYSANAGVAGNIEVSRALGGNLMLCVHTGSGKVYAKGFTAISEPGRGPMGSLYRPSDTTPLINDPGGGSLDTVMYQSRVTFTPAGIKDPQLLPVDVTYQIEGEVYSFGYDKACFKLILKTQEFTGWMTHVDEVRCTHM